MGEKGNYGHLDSWQSKAVINDHFIRLSTIPRHAESDMIVTTIIKNIPESIRRTIERISNLEQESALSDSGSENSRQYRCRTGPKWAWKYFASVDSIYYFQVDDAYPDASPTMCWKFTSRDNMVGFGDDPLDWFEEWDPEAGDVEEPTPYCWDLLEFYELCFDFDEPIFGDMDLYSDGDPPEGAVKFDENEGLQVSDLGMFRQPFTPRQ